jgi:integrase
MSEKQWGAIRKLPSGRYQASYVGPDGVRYAAPQTFSDDVRSPGGLKPRTGRDKAQEWLRARRSDIERGAWTSPRVLEAEAAAAAKKAESERFGLYAETWVSQRVSGKGLPLRPKTRAEYERQLRGGLSRFKGDLLTEITPARVRTWHADRMTSGKTAAGAEARLLRAILNTALVDGLITSNPVPSNLTRTQTGKKHRPPTIDELTVILDEIGPFFRLAILLAAYGGLRTGEWRALRRRDLTVSDGRVLVDVERAAQYIPRVGWVVGKPKSDEGVRIVPLPKGLTGDVETHLQQFVGPFPDDLIFPPVKSGAFLHDRQFNRHWNRARDAAGIRDVVREHDLRGFAGTAYAQSGATLRETMAFLGHSTTAAAMAYQATTGREAELTDRMPLPIAKPKLARHSK